MLQAGFARIDITPPLGTSLQGYYRIRYADGILDPLLATAVAFENDGKLAVLISLDLIGCGQRFLDPIREAAAEKIGTDPEAIIIHCCHTHLGPKTGTGEAVEYIAKLKTYICDLVQLAVQDLKPVTEKKYTRGRVVDVAFVRRYRMKDGTAATNPGRLNPDIVAPIGTADEQSQLLILKRGRDPEIGIVNFQVHPDMIGGNTISADFPHFVRTTYEKLIDNSRCVYINGTQGNINHIDVRLPKEVNSGYKWARYAGIEIAASVISRYELAEELEGEEIRYGIQDTTVQIRQGTPEQRARAEQVWKVYKDNGCSKDTANAFIAEKGWDITVAEAGRLARLDGEKEKTLHLSAIAVGDVTFAAFPGEPFVDVGRTIKSRSPFTLTMPLCCANGMEGYYPMREDYQEDGYELRVAKYEEGTAEQLIDTSVELLNSLK